MKKNVPLEELSLDELKAKKNLLKGAIIGLACLLVIVLIAFIYLAVTAKKISLLTVVIGCSLTFLPTITTLRQINAEIIKRSSK